MKRYRLTLKKKPIAGDTLEINGNVFTFIESEKYLQVEFEAETASETLTDIGSYIEEIT